VTYGQPVHFARPREWLAITDHADAMGLIDALKFGVAIPEGAPTSQQERAYTSPIWYKP
jgi:hypothetical protein